MTNQELVKQTIAHKELNRVPYCIHLASSGFWKHADDLIKRYATPDIKKLLNDNIVDKWDGVKLAIGNSVFGTSAPWWDWHNPPAEYSVNFDAPSYLLKTRGTGDYDGFIEKIKRVKDVTGNYVTVLFFAAHIEKAQFARGLENFLADMAGDSEFTRKILAQIITKNMAALDNVVGIEEIDGILLGSDWGTQRDLLISYDMWKDYIAPGERQMYDFINENGKDVWIHSCGNIEKIIPDLIELGVSVLNPIQPECMDIYKIKESYGIDLTFWGGISTQQTLPNGTPKDVVTETRQVIEMMRKGGGYITSSSQEIQDDVPFENLCALIDTAKEYA